MCGSAAFHEFSSLFSLLDYNFCLLFYVNSLPQFFFFSRGYAINISIREIIMLFYK